MKSKRGAGVELCSGCGMEIAVSQREKHEQTPEHIRLTAEAEEFKARKAAGKKADDPSPAAIDHGSRIPAGPGRRPKTQWRIYRLISEGYSNKEARRILKGQGVSDGAFDMALSRIRRSKELQNQLREILTSNENEGLRGAHEPCGDVMLFPDVEDPNEYSCLKCGYTVNVKRINLGSEVFGRTPSLELHPDGNLGAGTPFNALRAAGIILNAKHCLKGKPDPKITFQGEVKSRLWSLLKGFEYDMSATDELTKIILKEAKKAYGRSKPAKIEQALLTGLLKAVYLNPKDHRLQKCIDWMMVGNGTSTVTPFLLTASMATQ